MYLFGELTELEYDIIGIGSVTDGIGTSQKHLERNVGNQFAHFGQSFPWIFMKESHSHIKSGASPIFKSKKIVHVLRNIWTDSKQISRSDSCGQQ